MRLPFPASFPLVAGLLAGALPVRAEQNFSGFTNRVGTVALTDKPQWWNFDTTSRAQAQDAYSNFYLMALTVPMGWTGSYDELDIATSIPGTTSQAWRNATYTTIDYFRYQNFGAHALFIAQEDTTRLPDQQAGAMLESLNEDTQGLSHFPPSTWIGYTAAGAAGCASSCCGGAGLGSGEILGYINDGANTADNLTVGHRLAVLENANQIAGSGDVPADPLNINTYSGANTLNMDALPNYTSDMDFSMVTANEQPTTFASCWPFPGYNPSTLVLNDASGNVRGSLLIGFGGSRYFCDDYSGVTISVTNDDTGQGVPVGTIDLNTYALVYEIPIATQVDGGGAHGGELPNNDADQHYTVTFSNLYVDDADQGGAPIGPLTYTYHFAIFDPTIVQSEPAAPTTPIVNLSTRAYVGTGDQVLIAGFVIEGTQPLRVALRARGPSLESVGLTGVVPNPTFTIYDAQQNVVGTVNYPWASGMNAQLIQAYNFAPGTASEPAAIVTLNPGAYTAVVSDANGATGTGIIEVFNADSASSSRLANVSTRGEVLTGQNQMIAGVIAHTAETIVIRGTGPSLAASGISNYVPTPQLAVYNSAGQLITRSAANWQTDPRNASLLTGGVNAGFAPNSAGDAAMVFTLPAAGSYTVMLSDANGKAGVGLVEVFEVNQ